MPHILGGWAGLRLLLLLLLLQVGSTIIKGQHFVTVLNRVLVASPDLQVFVERMAVSTFNTHSRYETRGKRNTQSVRQKRLGYYFDSMHYF